MLPVLDRRRFVRLCASSLLTGGLPGLYAWRVEPHWIEIVRRDLPVANLPSSLVGQTLVQLSDLHVGPEVDDDFLRHGFDLVRGLDPAILAITGDFMTCRRGEQLDHALRVLDGLPTARLGTVAVLGNHDYGMPARYGDVADRLAAGLGSLGVRVLRNEARTVGGLTVAGLDDVWARRSAPEEVIPGLTNDAANLVLCHNPDAVDSPGWGDYRGWVLAGHTHGGQCKLPYLPPPRLPVKNRRYVEGAIDLHDGRWLYVNRALGHLMRVRFNARPEITAFRLTRA